MAQHIGQFYSGTSGLVLPVANKRAFPPAYRDKSRLTYYASLFNSLEVNSSFYKVPMAVTVNKWAQSVPAHFTFTFKLFREITHNKLLAFDTVLVERFMQVINQAGNNKGCLLVQFPASTQYNLPQLEILLDCIRLCDEKREWKLSLEFRHVSWYQQATYRLLSYYGAGVVIHDMPNSATPNIKSSVPFWYLRFHGPTGKYSGGYSDDFLRGQARLVNTWLAAGQDVYCYFNNTIGDAVKNLATMNAYVETLQSKNAA